MAWPKLLTSLFRRERLDSDMDEELRSHVELRAADLVAKGTAPEEAARRARLEFGSAENYKEECRETRTLALLHDIVADMRYGLRMLRRAPGFTAVAVLTLALGIGANTAMFSAVDAVLLRAFPYHRPNQLVAVWESNPDVGGFLGPRMPVRMKSFLRWKEQAKSFADLAIMTSDGKNLGGVQTPERIEAGQASSNFFTMLGVTPELGRGFLPRDGEPGHDRIAIITHALWQKQFGGDSKAIGKTLTIDQVPYEIVGVLPAKFYLPAMWGGFDQTKAEVWTPLNTSPNQSPEALMPNVNMVYGRLNPGVSLAQAKSELAVIEQQLVREMPKEYEKFGVGVFTLKEEDVGEGQRRSLIVLQMAVGFVLLIACANVASLLLTRAASRAKELAVRRALGASRARLIRQLLVESLLVSIVGGAGGLLVAWWCVDLLRSASNSPMYALKNVRLDPLVLGFSAGAVLVCALLFGMAPAALAAGQNVQQAIAKGGRAGSAGISARLRGALVVLEIALALVPLAGAGLMIRTLRALLDQNLGFQPEHVLIARVALPEQIGSRGAQIAFTTQLLDKLRANPGVEAAAGADGIPLHSLDYTTYYVEGSTEGRSGDFEGVTAGYFATMGTPLLRGRTFTAAEAAADHPGVAVVNEAFAQREWPNQDPIGKVIFRDKQDKNSQLRIIGVVPNIHQVKLSVDALPQVFTPSQTLGGWLLVRGRGDTTALAPLVRSAVHDIDKNIVVYGVNPYTDSIRENVADQRFTMALLVAFAGLALALSAIGLYGVLAYTVQQRTQEIGVRMALGALPRDVSRMVVGQGARAVAAGIALGVMGAIGLTTVMAKLLFGVKPYDPLTYAAVVVLIGIVALVASYIPARRAAKVDPMVALRYE